MSIIDAINRLLPDSNLRELKKLWPIVAHVNEIRGTAAIQNLQLPDLPKKTEEFKARIAAGETTDDILPEAFAVACRACELIRGTSVKVGRLEFLWDMVPFDVQILGGIALHRGCIAEMKTGEGKTLVCTLPVYLNALAGKGVHVVTVNDYLARRDSGWMGLLYNTLGLTTGCIVHGLSSQQRRAAYAADITYGTNNEFGFDYLRDNMAGSRKSQVQRGLHYAIVDEVDSILVDEARTPLIISQPAQESTTKYLSYARLVGNLQENTHYNKDEKQRTAVLTEEGIKKMEELLGVENIYTEKGFEEVHHIEQALRAHAIYKRDVDYIVREGEVIIVDEFTGRLMPGRRYSHGLHQAIEAKEGVEVQRESRTLATITFQNYFRLFTKLAGMTGTAKTEEEEFESIYKLRVITIPTHRAMVRTDHPDAVYRTVTAKFKAVAKLAKEKHATGQPILIGTTSVEKSEVMSALLQQDGIPHQVLNAKNHEKEAEIVAGAGQKGSVTIATNMAGRGTDIKLGPDVPALGGLAILGTERHEARRIDNQLRGRAGRQGDPGESRFFVSMEDDLMRLFGGDRLKSMMIRLNVPEDMPLQNRMVSRSIESAQKRVEGHHFDVRRHVLQYDDVMNKHRTLIYKRRQKLLDKIAEAETGGEDASLETSALHGEIMDLLRQEAEQIVNQHAPDDDPETWNVPEMRETLAALHPSLKEIIQHDLKQSRAEAQEHVAKALLALYQQKCAAETPAVVLQAERIVSLRSIDSLWMEHIDDMAHLREQVAFSGYAQRDPKVEYQDQGFRRFHQLILNINGTIVRTLIQADLKQFTPRLIQEAEQELEGAQTNEAAIEGQLAETGVTKDVIRVRSDAEKPRYKIQDTKNPQSPKPKAQSFDKVGRNDPCPCGSGKKYKKCHGKEG